MGMQAAKRTALMFTALVVGAASVVVVTRANEPRPLGAAECDLTLEPRYLAKDRLHRWTNARGCKVRLDVLMTRDGPEHCDMQALRGLVLGIPLGAVTTPRNTRIYTRGAGRARRDVRLPYGAEDTGYRQGDVALWMLRGEASYVYLVSPQHVEAWPLQRTPRVCA
jgi:hypothetical protein